MVRIKFGRKVFNDQGNWFHCDYMCRREVTEIGGYRQMLKFMGYRPDLYGTPKLKGVM